MSGREHIIKAVIEAGYHPLSRGGIALPTVRLYKWEPGGIRRELVLVFDTAGRLRAWSEWENKRISLDDGMGRRSRLEEHLED